MIGHAKQVTEDIAYTLGIVGPFMSIPQIYGVWVQHDTIGVSLFSWAAFALLSAFWCYYGIKHHEKPLMISQGLWTIMNAMVFIGVLIYR